MAFCISPQLGLELLPDNQFGPPAAAGPKHDEVDEDGDPPELARAPSTEDRVALDMQRETGLQTSFSDVKVRQVAGSVWGAALG